MSLLPHDLTDLALAPVLVTLDSQLESFVGLEADEITSRIALETNRQPCDGEQRAQAALETVIRFVDLHGWQVGWTPRGLCVQHDAHRVTLAVPAELRAYLSGP